MRAKMRLGKRPDHIDNERGGVLCRAFSVGAASLFTRFIESLDPWLRMAKTINGFHDYDWFSRLVLWIIWSR
jgi:hypothetical protein